MSKKMLFDVWTSNTEETFQIIFSCLKSVHFIFYKRPWKQGKLHVIIQRFKDKLHTVRKVEPKFITKEIHEIVWTVV